MRDGDIREIMRAERMRATPPTQAGLEPGSSQASARLQPGLVGTLAVGGNPVPVYSLAAILHGGAAADRVETTGHHIVVTSGAQGPVGWIADRIVRSHLTDRRAVLPLPPVIATRLTGWFDGVLIVDGAPLLLLSPRKLDPRATRAPAAVGQAAPAIDMTTASPSGDTGPALVVMFSSPALPPSGASRYALSTRRIEAVVQSLDVTPVPGCPPHVTGVAAWRGQITPVVDFRPSGERRSAAEGNRFLIARCGGPLRGGSVAFAVDSELALHKPTREDREAEEAEPTPPFVAGTFMVSGNRLALLDLDTLLLTPVTQL
jgi:chemotaxis signal transduction protein